MTISTTTNRVAYTGNGVTTAFAVPFQFFATADLVVKEVVIATGVETLKTITTHYTVSGGSGATGTVTMLTAPASTVRLIIYKDPTRTQALDLVANDPLPAENTEAALDKIVSQVQRANDLASRSLRQPEGDVTAIDYLPNVVDRVSKFLAFDADGDPIAAAGTSADLGPVSAFMDTLLDDANQATAQATLGLVPGTDVADAGAVTASGLTMSTAKILGRTTAGTGAIEEITPIFSKYFESAVQTITAAGQLTLAHGLGVAPTLVQALLKNVTGEAGYVTDDIVVTNPSGNDPAASTSRGLSIVPTATDVVVRIGSDAQSIGIINKTTGGATAIVNANWKLIIRAWA